MTLSETFRRTEKLAIDNSPAILTGLAVAGTLATIALTAKSTIKAIEIIEAEEGCGALKREYEYRDDIWKQRIKATWKVYIPPAIAASATIGAIVCSNRIGAKRAAAIAAAYSISDKAFAEYRQKVVEKLGEKQEQTVRDEVAQDRVNTLEKGRNEIIISSDLECMVLDDASGRYFKSDVETLRRAQNDINEKIINEMYASLSDFYELIGLPLTSISEELGWNADHLLELGFSSTLTPDNRPCLVMGYRLAPIRGFSRLQ